MTSLARHLALGIPISDFQGVPTQHWCGFWGPNPDPHVYIATTLTTEQSPQLPRWSFWKWLLSYCLLLPPDPLWEVVSDNLELLVCSHGALSLPLNIRLAHNTGISWLVGFFPAGYCFDHRVCIWIFHAQGEHQYLFAGCQCMVLWYSIYTAYQWIIHINAMGKSRTNIMIYHIA